MNKVLFISFSIKGRHKEDFDGFGYNPSLGIISLATWLELFGYETATLDIGYSDYTFNQIMKYIEEFEPMLIGLSLYTENYKVGLNFAREVKRLNSKIKIAAGGPHPSLCPEDLIHDDAIDFVAYMEGECTLLELAEALSSNQRTIKFCEIEGLIFKEKGESIRSKSRKKICDLDLLPIPKRELMGIEKYDKYVAISTSRGCPGRCIYCSATTLSGATYRFRSVENILLEMVMINYLLNGRLVRISILDDTFTADQNRIRKFAGLVARYNNKILWHCESRIDAVNEEILELMSKSNCVMIQYGMESGSQEVLDKIHKNIDLEHAKKFIEITAKKGIQVCLSFMVGHFCDTKATMEETCNFIEECYEKYQAEMALSYNTPFPGTWQYTHMKELGMRIETDDFSLYDLIHPIVETDNFTIEDQSNCFYRVRPYLFRSKKIKKVMETCKYE